MKGWPSCFFQQKNLSLMKYLRITFVFALSVLLLAGCAKEEALTQLQQDDPRIEQAMDMVQSYNLTADTPVDLSPEDMKAAIQDEISGEAAPPCETGEGCCYSTFEYVQFMNAYGCTSNCPVEWDLNCDGVINTADLLIFLTRFPCPTIAMALGSSANANNVLYVFDQDDGVIKNLTTINGDLWFNSSIDIDAAAWFVNGVEVSNAVNGIQLEYPGAGSYHAAIPCNGYYEITLKISVMCKIYTYTECLLIKLPGNPNCTEAYCTI